MDQSEKPVCVACQGTGKCSRCNGKGTIISSATTPIASLAGQVRGESQSARICTKCYGSGTCQSCNGSGVSA